MKGALSLASAMLLPLALLFGQANVGTAQARPATNPVTVQFDYAGAEALLDAVERTSLTDPKMTKLLEVRGLRAMVDNVTRYFGTYDRNKFQIELRSFVQTRESVRSPFGLGQVFRTRQQVRSLIASLKENEAAIIREMLKRLEPYRPNTGPLAAKIYFVAGGNSDGFVLDGDDEPAFFVALDKASGDLAGVQQNMTHELYHVMQKSAARRVPTLARIVRNPAQLLAPERLVATTLWRARLITPPMR
jgi:hypothetical protein